MSFRRDHILLEVLLFILAATVLCTIDFLVVNLAPATAASTVYEVVLYVTAFVVGWNIPNVVKRMWT